MEGGGSNEDAECILRSLTDAQEFSTLYVRHSVAVFRFLARQTDRQSAEDLLAEVFITAFRIRARYDGTGTSALGWLLGIAANVARHHHRSYGRFMRLRRRAEEHAHAAESEEDQRVEQRLDSDAARPQIAAALTDLPESQREVLLLSAFDLEYDDMAKALGVPVGTVRSRLSRARAHMRELLGPDGKYPLVEPERVRIETIEQAGEIDG